MSQTKVNANLTRHCWLGAYFVRAKHGNEIPASAILAHGNSRDGRRLRDFSGKANVQGCIQLGNAKLPPIQLESTGCVFSGLRVMLALERGVLGTFGKEVTKSSLQMPQGLLNRNAAYLIKPDELWLLLEFGKHGRSLGIVDLLLTLKPCIRSLTKHVVIGKTHTSERFGKVLLLRRRWVEPEFVGTFRFHANILHKTINLCKDSLQEKNAGIHLSTNTTKIDKQW